MRRNRFAPALALTIVLALVGTAGLSTTDAAADSDDKVTLNALFFTDGPDGPEGGTSKFTVHYDTSKKKGFRVAFSEDEVAGTGDQWRAAGWNAAAVATILTGSPLQGAEIRFDVNGRIDGPSAGALMTIGLLSLMRGDDIKKNITMTGTINPDGTVGPVGGIPYKIDGVSKAKKKRMLIPLGQRNSADQDGELVDVVRAGRREGVKVKEVSNIYQAYKAFTGKKLPRPKPEDIELSDDTYDDIAAKVKSLEADFAESDGEFGALDPAAQEIPIVANVAGDAAAAAEQAELLASNGLQAGAYGEAWLAAAFANAAVTTAQALTVFYTQGADPFFEQIRSSTAAIGEIEAFIDELGNIKPKRVSDASILIEGYQGAIDAIALTDIADGFFEAAESAESEEEALDFIVRGGIFYELAGSLVARSEDIVDIGEGGGGTKLDKSVKLNPVADFFRKAAEANLTAFDTLILEPQANAAGVNAEEYKYAFAANDLDYALAQASFAVLEGSLDDYLEGDKTAAYARLGGAVSLYARSASLLAKYYSLDAQLDENNDVVEVGNPRALAAALSFGSEQVERSVGLLQDRKVQAPLLVAGYEAASVDREGDAGDKLDALTAYLSGFTESRVLSYLGGFEEEGFGG